MNDFKENNAVLKIQFLFRFHTCIQKLKKLQDLNLEKLAKKLSFDEFKKIIIKKDIIETTQKFTLSLDNYKKGLCINPRILITSYLIKYYSKELLSEPTDRHPSDEYILNLSNNIISSLKTTNIREIWTILREFKDYFKRWSSNDKAVTIERLMISYYYRSQHIDKIKSGKLVDTKQQNYMIQELERQKNDILKSIKLTDIDADISYLEENYVDIFNSIQKSYYNN